MIFIDFNTFPIALYNAKKLQEKKKKTKKKKRKKWIAEIKVPELRHCWCENKVKPLNFVEFNKMLK